MTKQLAKAILSKEFKDLTASEKRLLPAAIAFLANKPLAQT